MMYFWTSYVFVEKHILGKSIFVQQWDWNEFDSQFSAFIQCESFDIKFSTSVLRLKRSLSVAM